MLFQGKPRAQLGERERERAPLPCGFKVIFLKQMCFVSCRYSHALITKSHPFEHTQTTQNILTVKNKKNTKT